MGIVGAAVRFAAWQTLGIVWLLTTAEFRPLGRVSFSVPETLGVAERWLGVPERVGTAFR